MMRTLTNHRFLALLGLFAVAACDETSMDLGFDELTPQEQLQLAILADPGSYDIAVDFTQVMNNVAMSRGMGGATQARALNAEARAAFAEARAAMLAGDHRRALEASAIARRLIARALIMTGGVPSVEDLIERLEDILLTIDPDVFDDPEALRAELEVIIAEAHALLAAGDSVAAAARAILGEQGTRLHRGRRDRRGDIDPDRARLAVALGATAVSLAERSIADEVVPTDAIETDAVDNRDRWLANAHEMLEKAEQALANGNFARAVHFAQHAQWSALKAVILPGGITQEELRTMLQLAEALLMDAEVALGDEASDLDLRLLNRAGSLIEIGIERLEAGHKRGVAALWRSAVISTWLIG